MKAIQNLTAKQRLMALAIAVALCALGLVIADVITSMIERRSIAEGLDKLFSNPARVALSAERVIRDEKALISVFSVAHKPKGSDMILVDIALLCGPATLAAVDRNGTLLVSVRDFRLVTVSGPGRYRMILTIYAPMVAAHGYEVLLKHDDGCSNGAQVVMLGNHSREIWNGPPLTSAFREEQGIWRGIYGAGPEWVSREPDQAWIARVRRHAS